MNRWIAGAVVGLAALATTGANAQTVQRLYALECGEAHAPDQARWSPGVNVGKPIDISDNCYLIRHAQGYLLWDTGVPDAVAAMPDGMPGALPWKRPKTLASQLAAIGVSPADIKFIAISHTHGDHVGNVDMFPAAPVLMQKAEYDFAFAQATKPFSAEHPVQKLEGDKDVFGDGSVTILSTPGHTPGHQSLLVKLPKTGEIVLSGDLAHFTDNWNNRRVPSMNVSADMTTASMQRVADLLAKDKAQLWINHDRVQSNGLKRLPEFYD